VSYETGLLRRFSYAWHLRRGEHPKREDVVYRRCQKVEVRGERMRCTSDGELTPPKSVHAWRLEPAALTFITPRR
jgi:diacylglycerol kinase family enzyme